MRDLRVEYRVYEGTLKVLNGVNLSLEKGEKVGIIGESACGKTTTVKTIMRLLAKNSKIAGGEVTYKGEDVLKMSKNLTKMAQDVASARNISVDEAMNKLRGGLTGETEGLKSIGVIMSEATTRGVPPRCEISSTIFATGCGKIPPADSTNPRTASAAPLRTRMVGRAPLA